MRIRATGIGGMVNCTFISRRDSLLKFFGGIHSHINRDSIGLLGAYPKYSEELPESPGKCSEQYGHCTFSAVRCHQMLRDLRGVTVVKKIPSNRSHH